VEPTLFLSASRSVPHARELRIHRTPNFTLERGGVLPLVQQAYYFDGELNERRDNLVLVFHSLTGSADAVGDWWRDVIGPGKAIDTRRYAVLCPNLLGSCYGTTGPRSCAEGQFPAVTPRDMARLAGTLVRALGVRSVSLATGGSLGGMVALEWNLLHPGYTRSTVVFAAPAAHTAWAVAWNAIQRQALKVGGQQGLALARMIGMMTYRTEAELDQRFGRRSGTDGSFEVSSYLHHHGSKLVSRFETESYRVLTEAMDAHDIGEGRAGVDAALHALTGHVVGVGIPGDNLYSSGEVQRWVEAAGGTYRELASIHGHDAFLLEPEQVGRILAEALENGDGDRESDAWELLALGHREVLQ